MNYEFLSTDPSCIFRPVEDSVLRQPVYPGADFTLLDVLANELLWFASTPSLSKNALQKQLKLKAKTYPKGNTYPDTLHKAFALVGPFMIPLRRIEVCINDCVAFERQYKSLESCPACGESRYSSNKSARRVFFYMSMKDRIRRMFADVKTSKLLQSHAEVKYVFFFSNSKIFYNFFDRGGNQ